MFVADKLFFVLQQLGYTEQQTKRLVVGVEGKERSWRYQTFHLITRGPAGRGHMVLTLHRDTSLPYPPGHKAIFKGEAVKQEFSRILSAYRTKKENKQ
jgi:hypothetical protein